MNQITVGITGPNGFVASHLVRRLQAEENIKIVLVPREAFGNAEQLASLVAQCDTIVHLAGMNRGEDHEVHNINVQLVEKLVDALALCGRQPHVIFASSTQRELENAYGRSKKQGEALLATWAQQTGSSLSTLVIPNVYGAGCRPFYNSVVATFCHKLAQGEQPEVLQDKSVDFVWVNDLVDAILQVIAQRPTNTETKPIDTTSQLTVSELLAKLTGFRDHYFGDGIVPDMSSTFDASLYTTFLSYLDMKDHAHRPEIHTDNRGSLYEIIKLAGGGQIFFSTTKPGVIRGDHFHTRKIEWFCVLQGKAAIRLRRVGEETIQEFHVSGDSPQFISIPVLHTHQIENTGEENLLTMFWCNEVFSAEDADTYFEKVA